MRTLEALPQDVAAFFDEAAETRALSKILYPYLFAGYGQGTEQAKLQVGKRAAGDFEEQVKLALRRKAFRHATLAVGTTKEELQKLLTKATGEGWGVQELGRQIDRMFGLAERTRSLRIARTELTETINDGVTRTLEKEGVTEKEWSTVIDGQERPTHHDADGQVVGVRDQFQVGNSHAKYPGDENLPPEERVNCRCTPLAAGLAADRKRQFGQRFLRVHGSLERKFVVALRRLFAAQRARVLSHFPS